MSTSKPRRKHRVIVDITYSRPVSEADAAQGLSLKLSGYAISDNPVWLSDPATYINNVVVKRLSRLPIMRQEEPS